MHRHAGSSFLPGLFQSACLASALCPLPSARCMPILPPISSQAPLLHGLGALPSPKGPQGCASSMHGACHCLAPGPLPHCTSCSLLAWLSCCTLPFTSPHLSSVPFRQQPCYQPSWNSRGVEGIPMMIEVEVEWLKTKRQRHRCQLG